MTLSKKYKLAPYLALIPWFVGVVVFFIYPFFASMVFSFTDYNILDPMKFVGLRNYKSIFTVDPYFKKSMLQTMKYTVITVPAILTVSLFVAFILNFKLRAVKFFRTLYYIPSILGGNVAIAVVWKYIFGTTGILNLFFEQIHLAPVDWLTDPGVVLITIALFRIWRFGSAMIIFLAALQNVPVSLYEAALIDGASKIKTFLRITVPIISPVIFFNLVMQTIDTIQAFTGPFIITEGGPLKSTYFISYYIYDKAFRHFDFGYASALSWILFVVILIMTLIIFVTGKKWVYYSDSN